VPPEEYVAKVDWSYGQGGVTSIMITTSAGAILSAGAKRIGDSEVFYEFNDE